MTSFQSRSGFLPRRDSLRRVTERPSDCFNPDLGFSLVATRRPCGRGCGGVTFQSRSGFLPRRDSTATGESARCTCFNPDLGFSLVATPAVAGWHYPVRVSIPIWVSPSPRQATGPPASQTRWRFNPDLGFSLVATPSSLRHHSVRLFQSRSGFLPRRDRPQRPPARGLRTVSIPIWVSPSSRQGVIFR